MKLASLLAIVASLAGAPRVEAAPAAPDREVRAGFDQFVAAQNAHDLAGVGALLLDSPDFLWITRGTPVWGREAALKRFEALYQGTWALAPDTAAVRVFALDGGSAQLFAPVRFTIGAPGQAAQASPFLLNQVWVRTAKGWRIASLLPVPAPPAAPPAPAPAR